MKLNIGFKQSFKWLVDLYWLKQLLVDQLFTLKLLINVWYLTHVMDFLMILSRVEKDWETLHI